MTLLLFLATSAHGERLTAALKKAISKRQGAVGACVAPLSTGKITFDHDATLGMKPASIQKLITTAALFERFGPESNFATEIYAEEGKNGGILYLRGLGDPSLTTEGLWMLARAVRARGISRVNELVFDDSVFQGARAREGQRAYMGGSSGLSFNFNSFEVLACPTKTGEKAILTVEPFEAGLTAVGNVMTVSRGDSSIQVEEKGGASGPRYAVSGQVSVAEGCARQYRSVADPAVVAAELFREQLQYLQISVPPAARRGVVPSSARLIEHYRSKPLHEISWGVNHWSTNVIAEQMMIALGATAKRGLDEIPLSAQLDRDRALSALNSYASDFTSSKAIELLDGSGLSHKNRAPVDLFCNLLVSVSRKPNQNIEFENSLPVSGRSGTLKNRDFDLPDGVVRAKTGTLDGVSSLAGYLVSRRGNKYAFAIVQNSAPLKGEAVRVEDRFVQALYHEAD